MKRIILCLVIVTLLFSTIGCQSIPEADKKDGKLSSLEAGYIIMVVADTFIIGITLYGMSQIPKAYPRANPNDPEYKF